MSIYVAGPMTGLPQFNIPAFDRETGLLRSYGYDVVSPVELDGEEYREWAMKSTTGESMEGNPSGFTWLQVLSRDLELITHGDVTAITVLPGWARSRGARLETFVGGALHDLPIVQHDGFGNLMFVPELQLYRAWTGESRLRINRQLGEAVA